jgi:prenyltransferase beta subunit
VRRLLAILVLGGLALATSAAAAPNLANQAALDRTVRYLQDAQQPGGGFAVSGEPSQITSAWTALALAAAGINPQDQRRPGGVDVFAYLSSHYREGIDESECAPVSCTTALERELMVVNAAGSDTHDFGGVDLVAELLARARPDGSFPHVRGGQPGVNDTIFAVFALVPIEEPRAQAAIGPAADWIESIQHADGGWAWSATSAHDEVDMTGAAVQALIAAGRGRNAAVEDGIGYLRDAQNPDGGFPEFPGNPESNVASTAWAVQALWAVGENPESWLTGSKMQTEEPLDYIESLQQPDGRIRWKQSQDLNGIWMTAYCSVALAGHKWPIPAAPRSGRSTAPAEPGQGRGSQSGDGVIAGGGGRGAPLFSRPKLQSGGRTPGGARTIRDRGLEATNRSKTRRGANAVQPAGTQDTEATEAQQDRVVAVAGMTPGPDGGGDGPGSKGPGGGEVTGTVIGGELAPGAPGLHGSGSEEGEELAAIGIGSLALLVALGGAGWERRRQWGMS